MNDVMERPVESGGGEALGSFVRYALMCGAGAGIASSMTVALAAPLAGKPVAQPFNATSHWLWGDSAGRRTDVTASHTGTGMATNFGASLFWGALFAGHLAMRPRHSTGEILRDAAVMGVIASAVDYGLIPKRLTPGWELALPRASVAAGMGAMAVGLALGALVARPARRP